MILRVFLLTERGFFKIIIWGFWEGIEVRAGEEEVGGEGIRLYLILLYILFFFGVLDGRLLSINVF